MTVEGRRCGPAAAKKPWGRRPLKEQTQEGEGMRHKLIIDGNAVYEVDDECMACQEEEETSKTGGRKDRTWEELPGRPAGKQEKRRPFA